MRLLLSLCLSTAALLLSVGQSSGLGSTYLIGAGRYDITGPAAEVNMMGYAVLEQTTAGIHFRQWSRAFVIADAQNQSRVVFVSIDAQSASQIVKLEVVRRLQETYGPLYTEANVLISGTHTHSGPAGYFQYFLYLVTSLGFVQETFQALVGGIVESIRLAHEDLQPGRLLLNSGELLDANINRSPTAYLLNPPEERARFRFNVDKQMTVLKLVATNGEDIGMVDWFAVHAVSMNNTNSLISGDNKGVASYLMEEAMAPEGTLPHQARFVAAYAQSNEGDVSPNINGPRCIDTGDTCDMVSSTCNGRADLCVASGPGRDMFESNMIIGERQFRAGKALYENASTPVSGPVDFRHMYVNMSAVTVNVNGQQVHTCPPALGFSFAAGTTDGPTDAELNFAQGDTSGDNPLFELVRDVISEPTEAQIQCHAPKPILLNTGDLHEPYDWQASVLPLQLLRVGQLVIIGVPAEFTTMSGRRLREHVKQILVSRGFPQDTVIVIAGLSNAYANYVTTFEEYQHQRYEGASTAYGPHTLTAYLQEFGRLAEKLALGEVVGGGPTPPNLLSQQISLLTPVVYDAVPFRRRFGNVFNDADPSYTQGSTVRVEFWSGHPRNDLRTNSTFLTVERKSPGGGWVVVHTDASLHTRFEWRRINVPLGWSRVTVQWDIAPTTPPGIYRIRHFGNYKQIITGRIRPYGGTSREFDMVN